MMIQLGVVEGQALLVSSDKKIKESVVMHKWEKIECLFQFYRRCSMLAGVEKKVEFD